MAKTVTKRVSKRVRRGMKSIEKRMDDLTSEHSAGKIAGVAAAGLVGVAGVAAAMKHFRDERGTATLHVVPQDGAWVLSAGGSDEPLATYGTKKLAVHGGRAEARKSAPSSLVIHRLDGTIQASHTYGDS